jgi:hypothetical protein
MLLTAASALQRQRLRSSGKSALQATAEPKASPGDKAPPRVRFGSRLRKSSWDAKEEGGGRGDGADYLYELGNSSSVNLNIDTAQNAVHLDSLFAGNFLGQKSDIADGSLQKWDFRTYNNIVGDYYVSPRFMEKVAVR